MHANPFEMYTFFVIIFFSRFMLKVTKRCAVFAFMFFVSFSHSAIVSESAFFAVTAEFNFFSVVVIVVVLALIFGALYCILVFQTLCYTNIYIFFGIFIKDVQCARLSMCIALHIHCSCTDQIVSGDETTYKLIKIMWKLYKTNKTVRRAIN